MKKMLLLPLVSALFASPAMALTQPDDLVHINLNNGVVGVGDGYTHKTYSKKWKDIQVDPATRAALQKKNQELETQAGGEKFQILFLLIRDDAIIAVTFLSEEGAVLMMDWPKGQVCRLSLDSQAGFAGLRNQACGQ